MTIREISREGVDKFPHTGVLVVMPSVNEKEKLHYPLQMSLALEALNSVDSDMVILGIAGFQFETKEEFLARASSTFDAYVENCRNRGIEFPEHN